MPSLVLHDFHGQLGARFATLNGFEAASDYGDPLRESRFLHQSAGWIDLEFRSRICLLGEDRVSFLNGQVSNDVKALHAGEGCYAALVNSKGKMECDLNVFLLPEEILLDFEPGYRDGVIQRLEHYIVADDVQVVDVCPHYSLISIQGPKAPQAVEALSWELSIPLKQRSLSRQVVPHVGEVYLVRHARLGTEGFDLFVPMENLEHAARQTLEATRSIGGGPCGWSSWEQVRIEKGIPRFGVDMNNSNLPPETGLDKQMISYTKGCYIGQEVIARIRTYGRVAKALRGLEIHNAVTPPPAQTKLLKEGKPVGYLTSSLYSPRLEKMIALAYVRKECNQPGQSLDLDLDLDREGNQAFATVVPLPFL